MLIDFTVENFRSYRGEKTFSMVASPSKSLGENTHEIASVGLTVLRAAAIYGANASGKSNLLLAMDELSTLVESPLDDGPDPSASSVMSFALDPESREQPTRFRVRFVLEETLYDYEISRLPGSIHSESLTAYPHGRPQVWFTRVGRTIDPTRNLRGQKERMKELTAQGRSFLGVSAAFEHVQLAPVAWWITRNLSSRVNPLAVRRRHRELRGQPGWNYTTQRCLSDPTFRAWASGFLRHADLGIQGVDVVEREFFIGTKGAERQRYVEHDPYFTHTGEGGYTGRFAFHQESSGTRRLFGLLAHLQDAIANGSVLTLDEFGEGMHPVLTREIVKLFNDRESNPRSAQLVFTTHDTTLLSARFLRRDQVWFTEKTGTGVTDLYSLQDIKSVREDESFEKGYLRGRYGAIPFFSPFDFSLQEDAEGGSVPPVSGQRDSASGAES